MTTMTKRLLPLKGVYNFRDMGGIQTEDGRRIKKGVVFRAAELTGLTSEDKEYLKHFHLKYVYDYRDRAEAEQRPDPQIDRERHERIAVNGDDRSTALSEWDPGTFYRTFTRENFKKVYAEMPIRNASYRKLMSLVARPGENLPLVHHCAAGRDRTGVGAMLILLTLGVPVESVIEDYLYSNRTLNVYHRQLFEEASHYISGMKLKRFEDDFLLREEYIEASIHSINDTYGTFERYLEAEFGITADVRSKIKDFCLE